MQKTAINFRNKSYEVILEDGRVTYAETTTAPSPVRLGASQIVSNLKQAKRKVLQSLQRIPDPSMTFSD